ncbi:MAG: hypothetical protein LQ337_003280 [Flavoplaca oasis]|nr:MAG: hypothetical protein LQ337_003280 [Flavoplaca oasis]
MNRQAIRSSLVQSTSTARFPRLRQASQSGYIRALHIAPRALKPKLVNIATLSTFHDHPASLRVESLQLVKDVRAYATKANTLEAATESANSHDQDSLSLASSKPNSGKSDTVTMTKRDFDAIVKEKAEGLRQMKDQQRFTFVLVLVTLVMIAGAYYTGAIARKIGDHGTIRYRQWTFGRSPEIRKPQEETPERTKEVEGGGGTEKDEDRSIARLKKKINEERTRLQSMIEDEWNQSAEEADSVMKDRGLLKHGTQRQMKTFPHRDVPVVPP